MFACLEIERQTPQGLMEKARWLLKKPWAALETKTALGVEYPLITAHLTGRGAPLSALEELLAGGIRCLLTAPEGEELGARLGFASPRFEDFEEEVLLATACKLADLSDIPMYRRVVGVLDEEGNHARMLGKLLRHYVSARVVTGNRRVYEEAAEEMLAELGAPVILGDGLTGFSDCALLLCPGDRTEKLPLLPACPVLAGGVFADEKGCNVFSSPRVAAEDVAVPPGIDPHLFAGALYHYHAVRAGALFGESLLISGRRAKLAEGANIIREQAGYSGKRKGC